MSARVVPLGTLPAERVFARPRARSVFDHGERRRVVANAVERGGMVGCHPVVQTPSSRQMPAAEPVHE